MGGIIFSKELIMKISLVIAVAVDTLLLVSCATPSYSSDANGTYNRQVTQNDSRGISSDRPGPGGYTEFPSDATSSGSSGASSGGGIQEELRESEEENARLNTLVKALEKKIQLLESRLQALGAQK